MRRHRPARAARRRPLRPPARSAGRAVARRGVAGCSVFRVSTALQAGKAARRVPLSNGPPLASPTRPGSTRLDTGWCGMGGIEDRARRSELGTFAVPS